MNQYIAPDPSIFSQTASDFSFAGNYGDPIRNPPPISYPPPDCLYMIYLEFGADGKLIVKQLFAPRMAATIALTETGLYNAATDNNGVLSTNFENLIWNRPCFVTFVIKNTDWKFYWRDSPKKHDGIKFLPEKELQGGTGKSYVQNKSFYNARYLKVKDKNRVEHDAIRCENYIRDGNGAAILQNRHVDYCFEIYLEAPYLLPYPSTHLTLILDPDGQNQGPRTF